MKVQRLGGRVGEHDLRRIDPRAALGHAGGDQLSQRLETEGRIVAQPRRPPGTGDVTQRLFKPRSRQPAFRQPAGRRLQNVRPGLKLPPDDGEEIDGRIEARRSRKDQRLRRRRDEETRAPARLDHALRREAVVTLDDGGFRDPEVLGQTPDRRQPRAAPQRPALDAGAQGVGDETDARWRSGRTGTGWKTVHDFRGLCP